MQDYRLRVPQGTYSAFPTHTGGVDSPQSEPLILPERFEVMGAAIGSRGDGLHSSGPHVFAGIYDGLKPGQAPPLPPDLPPDPPAPYGPGGYDPRRGWHPDDDPGPITRYGERWMELYFLWRAARRRRLVMLMRRLGELLLELARLKRARSLNRLLYPGTLQFGVEIPIPRSDAIRDTGGRRWVLKRIEIVKKKIASLEERIRLIEEELKIRIGNEP